MKGNIDEFKQEIIDFFKEKHMDVDVVSNDFDTHSNKSQQCSISIVLREKTKKRGRRNDEETKT